MEQFLELQKLVKLSTKDVLKSASLNSRPEKGTSSILSDFFQSLVHQFIISARLFYVFSTSVDLIRQKNPQRNHSSLKVDINEIWAKIQTVVGRIFSFYTSNCAKYNFRYK